MPVVDVAFRLTGDRIPADHGYALLGAVSRHLSWIHGNDAVGIHPIFGRLVGNRLLVLTGASRLTFRLDSDHIAEVLPVAGKQLDIDGHTVRIGVPQTRVLRLAARLGSRLVVIKGFLEPEPFLEAVRRQLDGLGIQGTPGLLRRRSPKALEGHTGDEPARCPFIRRTLRIRDKEIVGYAVEVMGLTVQESIKLQEIGIGGRRRFGCGILLPTGELQP